ncbi:MAG: hypothetical protein IPM34_09930 [Saprospiraceae bacterium]|nr:hypothetical protein [Saprospiraceae bacterium]
MHDIEPFYHWKEVYDSADDPNSPFYGKSYDTLRYTNKIYNYYIHPYWDEIGSETLFVKLLYTDYEEGYCIIELMGEWNDCIYNDIMFLKRKLADRMIQKGIYRFILMCDHVFNFHGSDDCYYEEWKEDIQEEGGYICMLNLQTHILSELKQYGLQFHVQYGKNLQDINWRRMEPAVLKEFIENNI